MDSRGRSTDHRRTGERKNVGRWLVAVGGWKDEIEGQLALDGEWLVILSPDVGRETLFACAAASGPMVTRVTN